MSQVFGPCEAQCIPDCTMKYTVMIVSECPFVCKVPQEGAAVESPARRIVQRDFPSGRCEYRHRRFRHWLSPGSPQGHFQDWTDAIERREVRNNPPRSHGENLRCQVPDRIHGMIRKRELLITRYRFRSRTSGVHPMKSSRGAVFLAAAEKPSMASCRPSRSWTA